MPSSSSSQTITEPLSLIHSHFPQRPQAQPPSSNCESQPPIPQISQAQLPSAHTPTTLACLSTASIPAAVGSPSDTSAHSPPGSTFPPRPTHSTTAPNPIDPLPILSSPIDPPTVPTNSSLPSSDQSLNSHPMVTRTKDRTIKHRHLSDFVAFLSSTESTPTNFTQATKFEHWRTAMSEEIDALARNRTWTLVLPPTDQRVIGSKWVYKVKRNPDGTVERHKACLVAKGYTQEHGVDFEETYSPVIRATTIRVILSLAISSDWLVKQLDVSNAFLNGDLTERVYMEQPQGFVDSAHPDYVCLLHKSLYGLRQAPRAWFAKLSSILLKLGFNPSYYDPSLFLSHNKGQTTLILVYVDDILVTGSDTKHIQFCIQFLSSQFKIRDLGNIHFFLGIEATHTPDGIFLSQTKYLSDLLTRTNMHNSKPCLSPMASGTSLSQLGSSLCQNPPLYRNVVGALQYATLTRPELTFSVNKASQFMHNPIEDHWSAVKRILRYIAGTLDHGLHISSTSTTQIHAYSDADWADNVDDRRSTSGYCVYLGSNLVSWCAKKQPTVSRSSTEAEYRSLALTCTEIMWL